MASTNKILDEDLQEYLDGRLEGIRLYRVIAYLRAHPMKAATVGDMRRQDEMLRLLGRETLDEPIPARLTAILKNSEATQETARPAAANQEGQRPPAAAAAVVPVPAKSWGRLIEALAASLIFIVGALSGWGVNVYLTPKPPSEMDLVLSETAYAFSVFSSDGNYDLPYAPDRYDEFSAAAEKVFSRTIPRPDFSADGYEYTGARIAPAMSRNVGYLFYQSPKGDRISVVFWASKMDPDRMPISRMLGKVAARAWREQGFGFAILGGGSGDILDQVTKNAIAYYETAFAPQ